jgi:hypothetical protein
MLLRLAFWLAVLVFLLPSDPQQQARLYATVTTALERVTTFCDRNGETCAVGARVWANFVRKAEFALRLVGDLVGGAGRPDAAPPPRNRHGAGKSALHGTLLPSDLELPWGGRNGALPAAGRFAAGRAACATGVRGHMEDQESGIRFQVSGIRSGSREPSAP